jgi:hypothetical protein
VRPREPRRESRLRCEPRDRSARGGDAADVCSWWGRLEGISRTAYHGGQLFVEAAGCADRRPIVLYSSLILFRASP